MQIRDLESIFIPIYDVKHQLRDHIYSRTHKALEAGAKARSEISDPAALADRKSAVRSKLLEGLGGLPSSDAPLDPQTTKVLNLDGYRIEAVTFKSRPGTRVTSNVYVPGGRSSADGAVIFVCGHRDPAKHDAQYQTVCQHLVKAGLLVIAIDPIGQGERFSYADAAADDGSLIVGPSTTDHEHVGAQCWPLGDGLARYFVHDIIRTVDYLLTRSDVNPRRIGITGNSGGGLQTCLAMICDERIAAAAPGTFLSSRGTIQLSGLPQDAEQIWPGMAGAGFDHTDMLLAFAPKPVMVLAVSDDFFPVEGTEQSVDEAKRFWSLYGQESELVLVVDRADHQYTEFLADRAAAFFGDHLLQAPVPPLPLEIRTLPHEQLWCTATGQIKLDQPSARAVYDENIDRLAELEHARQSLLPGDRLNRARSWLKQTVFAPRKIVPAKPRCCGEWVVSDAGSAMKASSYVWFSQAGMLSHALLFQADNAGTLNEAAELPVSVGLWEGGTSRLEEHRSWIGQICAAGRRALVLNVTGEGLLEPHSIYPVFGMRERFGTLHKFDTDLYGLEDSLAALRVFEVSRALEIASWLQDGSAEGRKLHAKGRFSMLAELAAFVDGGAYPVDAEDGLGAVADIVRDRFYRREQLAGLILPGMLRYLDLPEIR